MWNTFLILPSIIIKMQSINLKSLNFLTRTINYLRVTKEYKSHEYFYVLHSNINYYSLVSSDQSLLIDMTQELEVHYF